jgi:uncharacterized protein with PIN domain
MFTTVFMANSKQQQIFIKSDREIAYIGKQKYITILPLHNIHENARFEVFMAVTTKNAVFWDVTQCGSCKNRHFRGM